MWIRYTYYLDNDVLGDVVSKINFMHHKFLDFTSQQNES